MVALFNRVESDKYPRCGLARHRSPPPVPVAASKMQKLLFQTTNLFLNFWRIFVIALSASVRFEFFSTFVWMTWTLR